MANIISDLFKCTEFRFHSEFRLPQFKIFGIQCSRNSAQVTECATIGPFPTSWCTISILSHFWDTLTKFEAFFDTLKYCDIDTFNGYTACPAEKKGTFSILIGGIIALASVHHRYTADFNVIRILLHFQLIPTAIWLRSNWPITDLQKAEGSCKVTRPTTVAVMYMPFFLWGSFKRFNKKLVEIELVRALKMFLKILKCAYKWARSSSFSHFLRSFCLIDFATWSFTWSQ